jgi:NADH-quinone oxidoreductase subunit M
MKPAIARVVERLDGKALATLPTDMTIAPGIPGFAAPAHAAEAHH